MKLGQGYIFTGVCDSVHRGQWYPSMPCSRSPGGWYSSIPCRFPGPHTGGKFRGSGWGGLQGHTQGGSWGGSGRGEGGVSRPTPKGEVEGDMAKGGSLGPHQGGVCSRGVPSSRESAPGGCLVPGCVRPPRWLLLRVVCILLKCILVSISCSFWENWAKSLLPPSPPLFSFM